MIDELQAVRALRPSDPPDDPAARDGALRALRAAAPDAPGATCPPRRPRLGAVFVLAAALVALLVAGGALVLLHGRTPSRRVADSRGTGRIVTTDGTTLLTDRGGVLHATGHGALLAGTVSQYRRAVDAGETVRIGEDAKLELAAQTALIHSIEANRASAGAVVAMDPSTGQILALNILAEHGDPALADPASVGSAFLPITALAGLGSGMISPGQSYDDVGRFCVSPRVCLRNSGGVAHGVIGISAALRFSDSDFFYNVGALLNSSARFGSWLQEWASALGLGRRTGIDLPGEAAGVIPAQVTTRRRWTVRDSAELAVGQGAVRLTAVQLAVAYAALENGLRVPTPHLADAIVNSSGKVLRRIAPPGNQSVSVGRTFHAIIDDGMHESAQSAGGTSDDVMGSFPLPVYGMAGTGHPIDGSPGRRTDSAWYACFVPASATRRPIVVVVRVDGAGSGSGDVAAAPVARQVLSQWFLGHPGPYVAGSNLTR